MTNKHEHKHDHRKHARLKYCADCQKPYCLDCGQEWNQFAYTFTQTAYNNSVGTSYYVAPRQVLPDTAKIDAPPYTPTVTCKHTN